MTERDKEIKLYKGFINKFAPLIALPDNFNFIDSTDIKINNTCFKTQTLSFESEDNINIQLKKEHIDTIKARNVRLIFNKKGKKLVNRWMDACIDIYNEALRILHNKVRYLDFTKRCYVPTNFLKLRDEMVGYKVNIARNFVNNFIWDHSLDLAIKDAVTYFKEAFKRKTNKIRQLHYFSNKHRTELDASERKIKKFESQILRLCELIFRQRNNIQLTIERSRKIDDLKKEIEICKQNRLFNQDNIINLSILIYNKKLLIRQKGFISNKLLNSKKKIMNIETTCLQNHSNLNKMIFKILGENKEKLAYNPRTNKFNIGGLAITKQSILQKSGNKYYLFIPEAVPKEHIDETTRKQFGVWDPGARKFVTGGGDGILVKIGEGFDDKLTSLINRGEKLDYIINNDSNVHESPKSKYKLRQKRINNKKKCEAKIHNNVNELHWKVANFMTNNFNNILMGNMSVSSIVSNTGTLNKTTKKVMLKMRFFEFKQKLQNRCKRRNVGYVEVNERYTSKLCSVCGNLNSKLGGSEIFECPQCKLQIDRDINGFRNILIRHLGETS